VVHCRVSIARFTLDEGLELVSCFSVQLLEHTFIKKYDDGSVDLEAFIQNVMDPTERLKDLSSVSTVQLTHVV